VDRGTTISCRVADLKRCLPTTSVTNVQQLTYLLCKSYTTDSTDVVPAEPSHASDAVRVQVTIRQKLLLQQPNLAVVLVDQLLPAQTNNPPR